MESKYFNPIVKSEYSSNAEQPSREAIEKEIIKCLQDIDKKYYNPNFNLMGEIVNIFGDVNWDKVKLDIDRLNKIDEKLDRVIKLIVDQHSEEFFKILGFVRQVHTMIESSKIKLVEGRDVLSNINTIISNLSTGENSDWKLKSFYCTEIISKLNKTSLIFKIIQDCEVFVENSKIFDAICLLKKSHRDHFEYDKEFRGFNFVVPINMRFAKIKENIETKIIQNLNHILFFTAENVLERKISSMLTYFLNYYTKISIDNELTKPLQKFMFVIKSTVSSNLSVYNFDVEVNDLDDYFKENVVDLDSEKKLSSLIYLIKCLRHYDNTFSVFLKFNEKVQENLNNLVERSVKIITDLVKTVDFNKYDLDSKVEKVKFLNFFQIVLMVQFHSLTKIVELNNYLKSKDSISDFFEKIINNMYKFINLPLNVYKKMSAPREESDLSSQVNDSDLLQAESLVRMKINEILTNNIDNLPILYKVFNTFSKCSLKVLNLDMKSLNTSLNTYVFDLYSFYSKKIIPKKFFDINSFLSDWDGEISNFKFIQDFITKLNKLKELMTFSFEVGYVEVLKIFREIFNKYYEETKTLIENIKTKCTYNSQFNTIYEEILKTKEFKEVCVKLDFKKYEKKIIEVNETSDKYHLKVHNLISQLVFNSGSKISSDNLILISRNYKLMELLTKFVYCSENLINLGENFLFDLMKAEFSNAKMTAILEQVNSMHFIDMKSPNSNDLSTMIIICFKILEKLSSEMSKLVLTCKIEFAFLITSLVRNVSKSEYWLHEPQMLPDYFVTAFINEYNMFNSLFQYNLTGSQYEFITHNYLLLINDSFLNCVKNLSSNSINNFGVNLLIRNFEFIKDKLGSEKSFKDLAFMKTIYYFPNFIRLLLVDEDGIEDELKRYHEIRPYEEEFITPLLNIRTNTRHTLSEVEKNTIIKNVFN